MPTATSVYPASTSVFVPSFEASGKLQVEFSRNPKSFAINRYCGMKQTQKIGGVYLRIDAEQAGRILSQQHFEWPDGSPAPDGNWNTEKFTMPSFQTRRRAFPYVFGTRLVDNADWDIIGTHGRIAAQQAMTARTMRVLSLIQTAGNWGGNTATATTLGGGLWTSSSSTNQYILKTFNAVKEAVHQATLGMINPEFLKCVISPALAHDIRENPEIIDFLKQNPVAYGAIAGTEFFGRWGIPEILYGVRMVVEDTVKVTSKKGATKATSYAMSGSNAVFLYAPDAPGSKVNVDDVTVDTFNDGQPVFNTVTLFVYEDMTVETKTDTDNRRVQGRVVDDCAEELTAPASGYLVTAAA